MFFQEAVCHCERSEAIFLSWLVLFYTCIASAIIWLAFLCMPARWRMSEQWEAEGQLIQPLSMWPRLSVIVPACNERESLPLTLTSWLKQDYPNSEIILVDDQSSDGTAECAHTIAQRYNHTVTVINGTPPSPGWTGKLWALEQGIRVSSGDWFYLPMPIFFIILVCGEVL